VLNARRWKKNQNRLPAQIRDIEGRKKRRGGRREADARRVMFSDPAKESWGGAKKRRKGPPRKCTIPSPQKKSIQWETHLSKGGSLSETRGRKRGRCAVLAKKEGGSRSPANQKKGGHAIRRERCTLRLLRVENKKRQLLYFARKRGSPTPKGITQSVKNRAAGGGDFV